MSIFLFLFMIINVNALSKVDSKIIGGLSTDIEKFPYAVRFFNANILCSGCILNSWSVLTAAHCVDASKDVNDMMVGVGSSYLQDYEASIYDVLSFVIHEDYNKPIMFASDIAILFIDGPITFSKTVQKAILCPNMEWADVGQTDNIVVMGWGWTKPLGPYPAKNLMSTTLKFVPLRTCDKYLDMKLTEDMFCLYGDGERDTCQGDSGGGVEWKGQIIGIASHGHGCALKDKPGVYISVWHYRKWIEKQIGVFVENYCQMKREKETH